MTRASRNEARILTGGAARGIRRAPYQDYLIFYRISVDAVEVLRVLHAARDTDTITGDL